MPDQPRHLIPEEFAGNEWLVDELFDKYQADKNSVDKKWWPIFEQMAGDDQSDTQTSDTKTSAAAPSQGAAARTSGGDRPAVRRDDAAAKTSADKAASGTASTSSKTEQNTSGAGAEAPRKAQRAKSPAPSTTGSKAKGRPEGVDTETETSEGSGTKRPIRAQPEDRAKDKGQDKPAEDTVVKLRGPAKAVAANMDASLTVPTATTVRAVPAKLLIDNRLVINSHLARNRGGKVSFTHLVGYAVIRALANFPSQNVIYDEVDGKPAAVHPAHVNFGIAIDIPNKDGSRNLAARREHAARRAGRGPGSTERRAVLRPAVDRDRDQRLQPDLHPVRTPRPSP